MHAIDLDDASAFCAVYIAESMAYFEPGPLGDFSLLAERRLLTLAQAVSITAVAIVGARDTSEDALGGIVGDYIRAAASAVLSGELEARQPATLFTWQYSLKLLRSGAYGERGERAPILHFGWLVGVEDFTRWLAGLGFDLDLSGLLAELPSGAVALDARRAAVRRWTDAFIAEVRAYRADHTADETAKHYGVSTARIREKLRPSTIAQVARSPQAGCASGPWVGL